MEVQSMAIRRFALFLCTFGFLLIQTDVSLAQDKTASPTEATQPQPASKQKEEAIVRRERKAVALLEEVVSTAQSLKLPENRIRVQIAAGEMLWARDEARARALFSQAGAAMAQANEQTERADNDEAETMAQLRRELVLTAAQHDAELGFQLLNSTRTLARSEKNASETRVRADDVSLAESLLSIIAAHDPLAAYQKAVESLDRGEYPVTIGNVLRQLYAKDKEKFEKLSKKVLSKLTSNNLIASEEAGNLAVDLLSPGPISEKSQTTRAAGQNPALSEPAYRELLEATIAAALTAGPNTPHTQDFIGTVGVEFDVSTRGAIILNRDSGRSAVFVQPVSANQPDEEQARQQNIRRLLAKLQKLLPQIDQYLPDRAQTMRQKSTELGVDNNQLTSIDLDDSTSESLLTAAGQAPSQIQPQIYKQAAQKAIEEGKTDRALQIATDHLDESNRKTIMQAVELKKMVLDGSPERLAKFRQKLAALPSDSARVTAIIDMAVATAKDDQKLALTLLNDARNIVNKRARSYQDFGDQLKLAEAFASLDLKQSFDVLESGIAQLNEILAAAAVVNGFEAEVFREGELPLRGGSELGNMVARYGSELGALAKLDFDGARMTADKFQLNEARLLARLLIAQQVLGGQENSFDDKLHD
jgi:hypothetical protein